MGSRLSVKSQHKSSGTPAMDLRHGKPIMFVCVIWYVCEVETYSFSRIFLSFFRSYLGFNLMRSVGFWFWVYYAATRLAPQQQEHIQVVHSKPQNPDWIKWHSRNGPWTHQFVLKWCMSTLEVDLEIIVAIIMLMAVDNSHDDDCFYYHSWRNNVVIAFGTLSSFLTWLSEWRCLPVCPFAGDESWKIFMSI